MDTIKNGDVLLLSDGRMVRKLEDLGTEFSVRVQFIDKNSESFIGLETLEIECNLGQSPEVVSNFYSGWSVHVRLNLSEI